MRVLRPARKVESPGHHLAQPLRQAAALQGHIGRPADLLARGRDGSRDQDGEADGVVLAGRHRNHPAGPFTQTPQPEPSSIHVVPAGQRLGDGERVVGQQFEVAPEDRVIAVGALAVAQRDHTLRRQFSSERQEVISRGGAGARHQDHRREPPGSSRPDDPALQPVAGHLDGDRLLGHLVPRLGRWSRSSAAGTVGRSGTCCTSVSRHRGEISSPMHTRAAIDRDRGGDQPGD